MTSTTLRELINQGLGNTNQEEAADILLFSPAYPPDSGGAATFYSNLIAEISPDQKIILVTSYHADEPLISKNENVHLLRVFPRINILPVPVRVALETVVLFITTVYSAIIHQVDVIHAHGSSFSILGIGIATLFTRTPIIYDCQDEGVRPWLVQIGPVIKWFSSSKNVDELLVNGGVSRDKIKRIPVVNPDYVSEYANEVDEDSTKFEVIYVGELRDFKGVYKLIEAFEIFSRSKPDVQLTFVGEGEAKDDLKELRDEYDLETKVEFTGTLPHRQTLERIASASVLVHPSASETGPRSVTEAFELKTPVVATPVGRVPDVVRNEETGLLINRSPKAIHDALEKLYRDEEFRRSLASAAKEESESWSWDTVTERIVSTYAEAVD